MSRSRRVLAAALAALSLGACAAPGAWDGSVGRWGSVREVMRDGDDRARVEVGEVVASRHALGVGVLAGLAGEVTVLDGDVWTTRVDPDGRLVTERTDGTGVQAALLALARVERWVSLPLPPDPGRAGLEAAVVAAIERAGLSAAETVPFEIRGELAGLEAHVVRGACPLAPGADPDAPDAPLRIRRSRARGTLVGFLTRLPPGELTHHGRRAHVHVLLEDGPTAHVDRVEVASTAVLLLPDLSR